MTPINDDFEKEYKSDVWKGFSLPELVCLGSAVILMIGIMFYFVFMLEMDVSIALLVAMIPSVPVLLTVFGRNQEGDSLFMVNRTKRFQSATRTLKYACGEYETDRDMVDQMRNAVNRMGKSVDK